MTQNDYVTILCSDGEIKMNCEVLNNKYGSKLFGPGGNLIATDSTMLEYMESINRCAAPVLKIANSAVSVESEPPTIQQYTWDDIYNFYDPLTLRDYFGIDYTGKIMLFVTYWDNVLENEYLSYKSIHNRIKENNLEFRKMLAKLPYKFATIDSGTIYRRSDPLIEAGRAESRPLYLLFDKGKCISGLCCESRSKNDIFDNVVIDDVDQMIRAFFSKINFNIRSNFLIDANYMLKDIEYRQLKFVRLENNAVKPVLFKRNSKSSHKCAVLFLYDFSNMSKTMEEGIKQIYVDNYNKHRGKISLNRLDISRHPQLLSMLSIPKGGEKVVFFVNGQHSNYYTQFGTFSPEFSALFA